MPKAKSSTTSERIEFTKAINGLTAKQEAFMKAVEDLSLFKEDTLKGLDMEINDKKLELEELAKVFERKKKDGEIETQQHISEFKYEAVKEYLKVVGEVPIKESELAGLRAEVDALSQDRAEEIEKLQKEERASAKRGLEMAIRNKDLQHKAEIAEISASNKQLANEITSLNQTIESLKDEIAAQRELTRDVAKASASKGQISQTFGK